MRELSLESPALVAGFFFEGCTAIAQNEPRVATGHFWPFPSVIVPMAATGPEIANLRAFGGTVPPLLIDGLRVSVQSSSDGVVESPVGPRIVSGQARVVLSSLILLDRRRAATVQF